MQQVVIDASGQVAGSYSSARLAQFHADKGGAGHKVIGVENVVGFKAAQGQRVAAPLTKRVAAPSGQKPQLHPQHTTPTARAAAPLDFKRFSAAVDGERARAVKVMASPAAKGREGVCKELLAGPWRAEIIIAQLPNLPTDLERNLAR